MTFLVKVYTKQSKEEKLYLKEIEEELKAAGLPELVAQEVAERVEARAEDGWTKEKVKQETSVELRKLQEEIDRAYLTFRGLGSMGEYNVGEERNAPAGDYSPSDRPRTETMVECRNVEA